MDDAKKAGDVVAGVSAFFAALTLDSTQAYLNIAVAVLAIAWYLVRFYDYFKAKLRTRHREKMRRKK